MIAKRIDSLDISVHQRRKRAIKKLESQPTEITGSTPVARSRCIQFQIDFHRQRIAELEAELKTCAADCAPLKTRDEWLKTSVAEIFGDYDMRFVNRLNEFGVMYLEDLLKKTPGELKALSNVGTETIRLMYQRLEEIGFVRVQR